MKAKEKHIEGTASRPVFATRFGVIATTVGSAVGLGNIWRFPYEAGVHGGGAFMLLYIGFIFILGIPLLCAEYALGRSSRQGIFGAFRRLAPGTKWEKVGYIGIVAAMMILSFYSVVAGWTLEYFFGFTTGAFSVTSESGLHGAFEEFTSGGRPLLWTVVFLLINYAVVRRGVQKGIEKMSNVMMPALLLLIVAFCINSLLLPGAGEGLSFLFKPDFSQISGPVVIGAMGQAFFSLSLGLGCMLTYASYFNDNTNIVKSAAVTASLDTIMAVLAGVLIFPAVFTYGMSPAEGPKLVFEVLPSIFSQMPAGRIWAILFFFMLFMASLTSTISMCEIVIAFLTEEKGMKRGRACLLTVATAIVFGSLCALSFSYMSGMRLPLIGEVNFFKWFDYGSSSILLPMGGMLISIFTGWVLDRKVFNLEINGRGERDRSKGVTRSTLLSRVIIFALRYICPALILIIFIVNL